MTFRIRERKFDNFPLLRHWFYCRHRRRDFDGCGVHGHGRQSKEVKGISCQIWLFLYSENQSARSTVKPPSTSLDMKRRTKVNLVDSKPRRGAISLFIDSRTGSLSLEYRLENRKRRTSPNHAYQDTPPTLALLLVNQNSLTSIFSFCCGKDLFHDLGPFAHSYYLETLYSKIPVPCLWY